MRLSKKTRRSITKCVEDGLYQVEQLNSGFIKDADGTRLDVIAMLLHKIKQKVTRGQRRHE